MSQNKVLFELCNAYSKDNEGMTQAQYIRDKLGESTTSRQVEFSKFVQATKPEWQEIAEKFRETGKSPQYKRGSYKETVFKKAVVLWDLQNETEKEYEEPPEEKVVRKARGTKRKSTSRSKTTRASRNTQDTKRSTKRNTERNTKVIEDHPPPSPPTAKKRKTRLSPRMKENKNMDANDGDDDDSPNFEALETSLDSLTGELYQVQLHHNSMKHALAEAREANKELKKDKSALEVELEDISDSLEEESACLGQLKAENKRLRDEAAKCANDADAVARETATNKKLNQENAALKIALETTKKEHDQEVSKQAQNLEDKRVAIHKFQQEIATLRSELEQLGKLHCRTTESFSVQTKLLQEQCKTLVSPEATSHEQKSPMGVDDGRKARRISL